MAAVAEPVDSAPEPDFRLPQARTIPLQSALAVMVQVLLLEVLPVMIRFLAPLLLLGVVAAGLIQIRHLLALIMAVMAVLAVVEETATAV